MGKRRSKEFLASGECLVRPCPPARRGQTLDQLVRYPAAQDVCGNPSDHRIGRHVTGYHCACCYYGTISDMNAGEDNAPCTKPHVVSNPRSLMVRSCIGKLVHVAIGVKGNTRSIRECMCRRTINRVHNGANSDIPRDRAEVTNIGEGNFGKTSDAGSASDRRVANTHVVRDECAGSNRAPAVDICAANVNLGPGAAGAYGRVDRPSELPC